MESWQDLLAQSEAAVFVMCLLCIMQQEDKLASANKLPSNN